jgi:predicted CoA-binding protein
MMTPETLIQLLEAPGTVIAVVGATDDPNKYGHRIYRNLKHKGYTVYPVNPNRATVDGDPAYSNLAELPQKPDIVNVVVPPEATLAVLRECLDLQLKRVWLQPGAESDAVLAFLDAHDFAYLAQACIMIESRARA